MPATATTDGPDVEGLEQIATAARERLEQLDADEARLSLDALTDEDAAAELRNVQSERAAALAAIRQAELAGTEHERRITQERLDAEKAARDRAMGEARDLQPAREQAAADVDATAAAFARALTAYAEVSREQEIVLERAGQRALKAPGSACESALVRAFLDAGTPRGLIDLAGISPRPTPLTKSDPKTVSPPES